MTGNLVTVLGSDMYTHTHTHTYTKQPTDLFYFPPTCFKGFTAANELTYNSNSFQLHLIQCLKGFMVPGGNQDSSHNNGFMGVNYTKAKLPTFICGEWGLPTFNNLSEMIKVFMV